MHPILFRFPEFIPFLGGKALHTYGLMIALGFWFAMTIVSRECKRTGLPEQKIMDLFFATALAGLVGSRLLYIINSVILNPQASLLDDPFQVFRVWEGGLVFQGGIILAFPVVVYYVRRHKLPFFSVADTFAPALSLGHAIGRLGCLFAGCCFGRVCSIENPLCIIFPNLPETIAPPGVPLYPTQLLESAGEFLICAALLAYARRKPFSGAVFLIYIVVYSILRSIIEMYRGDSVRGFVIEPYLSIAQAISLAMIFAAIITWFKLAQKTKKGRA